MAGQSKKEINYELPIPEKISESPETLKSSSESVGNSQGEAKSNTVSNPVDIVIKQKFDKSNQQDILSKTAEKLIPIETSIKAGGNQYITYEKDKHETIGSVVNTFPCLRKDASGEFRPKAVKVEGKGSFTNYEPVSYTEEVENTRFPCGTYSINVTNRYDLSVGAGGVGITTVGNLKMGSGGRALLVAKEEMNVSSGNGNLNLRAKHNISLKADSVTLEAPNQVTTNCNLGVSKNAIINGCAFIDGEVYLNHITCPAEVHYTGGGIGSFGQLMTGVGPQGTEKGGGGTAVIAYADVSYIKDLYNSIAALKAPWILPDKVPVLILSDSGTTIASSAGNGGIKSNPEYSVFVYPHEHPFNNIPCSFTTGNEEMRVRASSLNSGTIGTSLPINHGYHTPTA